MRAVAFSELQQRARTEYQRKFAAAPARVRNAVALAALGEHRPLRYGGHYYRVPPLPWRAGVRLLVAENVIKDETASPEARARAVHTALRVAGECIEERRWTWRGRQWRTPRRNPFLDITEAQGALWLIGFLMEVPDEEPIKGGPGDEPIDLIQGFAGYMHSGWPVTAEGLPVSWAHYQYALRHVGRAEAREQLQMAIACRVAFGADEKGWKSYARELRKVS